VAAGQMTAGSGRERALRRVMRSTFDGAAANVFLGEKLRSEAAARFGPIPRAHVIPVGADGTPFRAAPPQARTGDRAKTVEVLYSGNLGRLHDVDTIAGALAGGLPAAVRIKFCGNGAGYRTLRSAAIGGEPGGQVTMGGNLPAAQWAEAMRAADVALVTMRPGAEALIMPSKTYSAMMAGQALLAVAPRESDLAALVRMHDAGWVIAPGDVAGLRAVLAKIATEPGEVLSRRRRAWEAGHRWYDQRVLAPKWSAVLHACQQRVGWEAAEPVR
jgi:glycosyltransferase involved in cell wall biosynthesis